MPRHAITLGIGLLAWLPVATIQAEDWTRFRGPNGLAISHDKGLPTSWTVDKNVLWRTELPGAGTSSPVTLGNRVFLTSYSGYGLSQEEPGDMENLMRHVICLDRNSGKILWSKEFKPELPESKYSAGNDGWHGYASSTPTTDGESLYVFFGKSGVYCLDLDGNERWHKSVGSSATGWGTGNSPVLYGDLLIVNATIESSSMVALNKKTGEEVWKISKFRGARNTPLLVDLPDGSTELIVSLPGSPEGKIAGYDPKTGEELWTCKGIPDGGYVCPSVVAHNGVIYAIGGRKNTAVAVRAGGRGDVSETHELWRTAKGSNVSSPVYHDGHLYWVHERQGTAYCLNAETGDVVYEQRLSPRPGIVYSSLTLADGKMYIVSQHAGSYVLAAKPKFELLAHNAFSDDESRTNASFVVSDGKLLLRNDKYIYCLAEQSAQ